MLLSVSGSDSSECEKVCTIECQTDSTLIIHILSVSVLNGLCICALHTSIFAMYSFIQKKRRKKKHEYMNCPKLNVSRETHTTFTNEIQDNTGEKPSEKGLVFIQERKGTEIKSLSRDRVETTKTDNSVVSFLILL